MVDISDDSNRSAQQVFDEAINQRFDSARTISVCLASVKRGAQPVFQCLETDEDLAGKFGRFLQEYCDAQRKDQKSVAYYSVDQHPGNDFVHYVDLADYPEAQSRVDGLIFPGNLDTFKEEEDFLRELSFYAIVAQLDERTIIGLRSMTPAQKPRRGKWSLRALCNPETGVYEELTRDLLLFDEEVDCLLYNNHVFITNRSKFETIFNFYQVIRNVAERALSILEKDLPIHNFEEFKKACLRHRTKQGMLARLNAGVDPSQFTIPKARAVIAKDPSLSSIVRTEGSEAILAYDPKNQWALLRFLNETTVRTLVTGSHFDAVNKRAL